MATAVLRKCLPLILLAVSFVWAKGQKPAVNTTTVASTPPPTKLPVVAGLHQQAYMIEQAGQYLAPAGAPSTKIIAGFEGFTAPVLFTNTGMLYLQRKETALSYHEEEALEHKGFPEEEIERRRNITNKAIYLDWEGANQNPVISWLTKAAGYSTYGSMPGKATHYTGILYKNLYPFIDLVCRVQEGTADGFAYRFIVHPGGDPSQIRMHFGGDLSGLKLDAGGDLIIASPIDKIKHAGLQAFYADSANAVDAAPTGVAIGARFEIQQQIVGFAIDRAYDASRTLVIDPFVSSTAAALTGTSAGVAKDVDYDYAGNMYVAGGGNGTVYQLAKFNASGVLQWTFNGTVNNPQWSFGPYFGGWVVEKTTGNVYLGQGFDFLTGFIVVRISTTGLYDNYITNGNPNFRENWKMIWNCNSGLPQIIVAGGGTNSNINLGMLSPPSVVPSAANLTGIADIAFQDMADMVIDPLTNSMYTVYASGSVPTLNNAIYRNDQPYSAATGVWNAATGYNVLQEAANRPYLAPGLNDNSANLLAVNPGWLFYWDGKNLKAFNKTTGAVAGTALSNGNTPLMQGGIVADACNHVFVGDVNGTIKVYLFDGNVFNDAAVPDIVIPGFENKPLYDLAYNETLKMLYASGNGFVAAIDVAAYCPNTVYGLTLSTNCSAASVAATLSPSAPLGSSITYSLYKENTLVSTNTSGLFSTLSSGVAYTVTATINQACSGTQATARFVMPGPTVSVAQTAAACFANTASITITAGGTAGPFSYSLDGVNYLGTATFSVLSAGVYNVRTRDAAGCITATPVTVLNADGPQLSFTKQDASCGNNNAAVTATVLTGTAPYQYSINGGLTYQNSNYFAGLLAGSHVLQVKDATGCVNAAIVTITSSTLPALTAIPSAATCGNTNGLVNVFGAAGEPPYLYSIDQNTFQASNTFANLTPGNYVVTVKDNNGCQQTTNIVISNTPAPAVTAVASQAACANANGAITVTGTGGLAPLQFSLNNGAFQSATVFSQLAAGTYTVAVQDVAGCTASTSVTIASASAGPAVAATALPSACNVNNGSIAAAASGGVAPYQYSLTNSTYQVSNTFAGLAPGTYVVYARDNFSCVSAFRIVVPPTSGPSLSVAQTASSCAASTGTITATGLGGVAPLSYSIDGANFFASSSFTGLAPGIYPVTVKDANGCGRTVTTSLPNVSGLTLTASSLASSCGGANGSVTAIPSGGIAPLQFSIDGVTYQAGNTFSALASGNYIAYVKDANNCVISRSIFVPVASAPVLTLNKQDATCATASGAIMASATNGIAPLTYSIDGSAFSTTNTFVNLTAANHTVIVKDAGGCTTSQTITIVNTAAASAPTDVTFTLRNALPCTGGVVKIKNLKGLPGGGGNHYQFSLDFGAYTGSNTFTGVAPGNHIITAINDNGCTVSRVAAIGTGTPATATATAVGTPCGTSNGSITITGVGGSVPYHASIDGAAIWQTFFPPGANSFTFTNLTPGIHTITMADDADFTVGPPDIPGACLTSIFVTVPTLGGPIVSAGKFDGTCAKNDGTISATGSGIAPFSFSLNGAAYQPSGVYSNLASGQYSISMKDGNGCVSATTISIANPSGPIITATSTAATCNNNNGSITATATNGVGVVSYSIDGFTFQAAGTFNGLAPGNYNVYAKDANGCYNVVTTTIAANPVPVVTAFAIPASCGVQDGSIIASNTGGTAPFQYSLDAVLYQSSNVFNGLNAGLYPVQIKDAKGCVSNSNVIVPNAGAAAIANTNVVATCGNNNGSATISLTGGTAPFTYSSDGVLFQPGNTLTNLSAGTALIAVKDAVGCLSQRLIVVAMHPVRYRLLHKW